MQLQSDERNLQQGLDNIKHEKWDWLIYRTTYADDEAWNRFKTTLEQESRNALAGSDAPEIADTLEWTFVEDRSTLDGVHKYELRARFRTWLAQGAVAAENLRVVDAAPVYRRPAAQMTPRYCYFLQVDEEALRNCHVNLVKADWTPDPEDDNGDFEAVCGYTGEDVGWFRMSWSMIGAYLWDSLNEETGHVYYRRLPGVLTS